MDIFHYPLILTNTTYYRWYASVRLVNTEPGDSGKYDLLQKTEIRQFVVKWKCECTGSWETEVQLLLRKNKKHNARNQTGNQKSTYKLRLVTDTLTWEESWTQTGLKEDDCPQEFTGIKLQEEICDQQLSEFYCVWSQPWGSRTFILITDDQKPVRCSSARLDSTCRK